MSQSRTDILKEIDKLREEIRVREERLDVLLLPEKRVQIVLPADFSINEEILRILRETKEGLSNSTMLEKLNILYPKYGIDKKRVNSAFVYLKKRGDIEPVARAKYRIKTQISHSEEQRVS